jgi:hypothetical protein
MQVHHGALQIYIKQALRKASKQSIALLLRAVKPRQVLCPKKDSGLPPSRKARKKYQEGRKW